MYLSTVPSTSTVLDPDPGVMYAPFLNYYINMDFESVNKRCISVLMSNAIFFYTSFRPVASWNEYAKEHYSIA